MSEINTEGIRSQLSFSGISSCTEFVPNKWKREKCQSCGMLALEHSGSAFTDDQVLNVIQHLAVEEANAIYTHASGATLYLGGFMASTPTYCSKHQITAIVNTAKDLDKFFVGWGNKQLKALKADPQITFHHISWEDSVLQKLGNNYDELEGGVRFVEEMLASGRNTLIHCAAGKSRSATLTTAYLMAKKNLKFNDAFVIVKNGRIIADPNSFFVKQLQDWSREPQFKVINQTLNPSDQ